MKHGFFMHKLCQVPRELLKTKVFNSPSAPLLRGTWQIKKNSFRIIFLKELDS